MTIYWSKQVDAEQLSVDNVAAVRWLLEKVGFLVTELTGPPGTFLLYERPGEPKPVRGFVWPGEWVWLIPAASGPYVSVRGRAPEGPRIGAQP